MFGRTLTDTTFPSLFWPTFAATTLLLTLALACGDSGLTDGLATFVDKGQMGQSGDAGVAESCETSSDCQEGLRCLDHHDQQFCVQTCEFGGLCPDRVSCKIAVNDAQGWCDPGVVDRTDRSGSGDDDDSGDDGNGATDTEGEGGDVVTVPRGDDGASADSCGSAVEARNVELLNEARADAGLPTLACDGPLGDVARLHSADMGERQFFDHVNPEGEGPWDRMDRYGVDGYEAAGENIALGYRTASDVHHGWMTSEGHRANILGEWYTHVGVGMVEVDGTRYWTQVFASF